MQLLHKIIIQKFDWRCFLCQKEIITTKTRTIIITIIEIITTIIIKTITTTEIITTIITADSGV
jgi:hypothetical protein